MSSTGRSLLVVGGTGFFGKSILDAFRRGLLSRWSVTRVIVAARQPGTLRATNLELIGRCVDLVALDITTADYLPHADIVIHAANTSDARRYAADPGAERAAILAAADNFVRVARAANGDARVVYTSSGAVYGAQPPTLRAIDESHRPTAAEELVAYKRDYAKAKLCAERAIARLGADPGMRVAVARCFAFVGAYLPRDQHFAIGNFLADGIAGRAIKVKARHPVIRSYLYADDLVEWLMVIADNASPRCPVFNVGSDEAIDVADLATRVARLYEVPVILPERASEPVDRYVPSIALAGGLGLSVRHNLDAALAATMRRIADDPRDDDGGNRIGPNYSAAAVH